MFEYKTRTEYKDGCKFISQDILLYDYIYNGDIEVECHIDYNVPGFGFVLLEENDNASLDSNIYVFKLGTENKYQVINKQLSQQNTVRDEYVEAGGSFKLPSSLMLTFEFVEGSRIKISKIKKDENGINKKTTMITYDLPHLFEDYKIGFYSSGGNVLKFAAVVSESPSNWVSNIFNGNGGRIHWIKNGFKIEDCEFDCEVESQLNHLEKGTYYFDFKTDNPDMKYYIYPSYLLDTDEQRPWDEIMATKEDEKKNILDYKNNSFKLEEDHDVNIKFKGKWGTVENIAIKKYKSDSFVETDYNSIKREASYIMFDLSKIKKINMRGAVNSVPEEGKHHVLLRGGKSYSVTDLGIELEKEYDYVYEDNKVTVGGKDFKIESANNKLIVFKNLNGYISELIVTYNNGDTVNVILQKTFKIIVNKELKTPIMVTDASEKPFDLASTYREVIEKEKQFDLFNKYKQLKLTKPINISNPDIMIYGTNSNNIDVNAKTIEAFASEYESISYNHYKVDYYNNMIRLEQAVKEKYKYCIVVYNACSKYRYEFTNWERQLVRVNRNKNTYLDHKVCDVIGAMIVYGIPEDAIFFEDRLYQIPDKSSINSVDNCTNLYDMIPESYYSVSRSNKFSIDNAIKSKYKYLIIDYIKDDSYTVNERDSYYEVDIATTKETVKVLYDSTEETINIYHILKLTDTKADNFIVLKKEG